MDECKELLKRIERKWLELSETERVELGGEVADLSTRMLAKLLNPELPRTGA